MHRITSRISPLLSHLILHGHSLTHPLSYRGNSLTLYGSGEENCQVEVQESCVLACLHCLHPHEIGCDTTLLPTYFSLLVLAHLSRTLVERNSNFRKLPLSFDTQSRLRISIPTLSFLRRDFPPLHRLLYPPVHF
jgi:hypothetical protein